MGQKSSKHKPDDSPGESKQSPRKVDHLDEHSILKSLDVKSVAKVPYTEDFMLARIIEVYDGDTVTIVFLHNHSPHHPIRMKIRIKSIDAPEKRTKCQYEKDAALHVTKYATKLMLDKILYIRLESWDKYGGRMIGDVYLKDKTKPISQHLLDKGMVKAYDGGKKTEWTAAECDKIRSCKI